MFRNIECTWRCSVFKVLTSLEVGLVQLEDFRDHCWIWRSISVLLAAQTSLLPEIRSLWSFTDVWKTSHIQFVPPKVWDSCGCGSVMVEECGQLLSVAFFWWLCRLLRHPGPELDTMRLVRVLTLGGRHSWLLVQWKEIFLNVAPSIWTAGFARRPWWCLLLRVTKGV